jgi:hypothetical protein
VGIDFQEPALLVLLAAAISCRPTSTVTGDAGATGAAATLAPRDDAGAKRPPALRAAKVAVPALPDLPTLNAHEAPADAPSDANLTGHPCRAVWTGDRAAPLACAQALLFGKHPSDGARLLVSRKVLRRDPASLPAIVDHRVDGTEGPVRDQGSAPACTAFATAAAVDHAVARWAAGTLPVSTMLIWSRYHSPFVETSLSSNLGQQVGAEKVWPFDPRIASAWVPCADMPKGTKSTCGATVDDPRLAKISAAPIAELTGVEYIATPLDPSVLVSKLASGQDVVVGMEVPDALIPKGRAGARYIPNYAKSGGTDAGHALLLSGYVHLPHGFYFLAHNSWGASWGDGGYAWIHEATLGSWVRQALAVDAEPADRDASGRARRVRGTTSCAPGLVPDSIRATCAPPCPDGSPRHDEVCAIANQCPASYVNLTGACVLSAPSAQGKDPSSGIAWACGPGGCAYTLPRPVDPTCSGSSCMVSCPAPDFHVARMGSEIVCVD